MQAGVLLLLPFLTIADPDPDRGAKRGFREKIRCIDNGKFYRNPNTPRDLAFRKVFYFFKILVGKSSRLKLAELENVGFLNLLLIADRQHQVDS